MRRTGGPSALLPTIPPYPSRVPTPRHGSAMVVKKEVSAQTKALRATLPATRLQLRPGAILHWHLVRRTLRS